MKLHVLGCGDAFGSGGRNQSAYLVDAGDRLFLLDCGPSALLALKRGGFEPSQLDAIFLSHLHGDHYGGLPFFVLEYLHESPRSKPLHVAGPPGTEERVRGLLGLMFGEPGEPRELPFMRFHTLWPESPAAIEDIEIFPFRVPHQVHEISLGLKVTYRGKALLYSGDSAWTELFVTHSRGADLFLCECSFFARATPNHLSYRELEKNLTRLACKKILITHMGDEVLERHAELRLPAAKDGMVVEI